MAQQLAKRSLDDVPVRGATGRGDDDDGRSQVRPGRPGVTGGLMAVFRWSGRQVSAACLTCLSVCLSVWTAKLDSKTAGDGERLTTAGGRKDYFRA